MISEMKMLGLHPQLRILQQRQISLSCLEINRKLKRSMWTLQRQKKLDRPSRRKLARILNKPKQMLLKRTRLKRRKRSRKNQLRISLSLSKTKRQKSKRRSNLSKTWSNRHMRRNNPHKRRSNLRRRSRSNLPKRRGNLLKRKKSLLKSLYRRLSKNLLRRKRLSKIFNSKTKMMSSSKNRRGSCIKEVTRWLSWRGILKFSNTEMRRERNSKKWHVLHLFLSYPWSFLRWFTVTPRVCQLHKVPKK